MRRVAWLVLAGVAALSTACGTVAPVTARAGGTPKPDGASPGQHAAGPATGTSPASAASTGSQQSCLPGQVGPIGASFVSAADGYLLGITLRECSATVSSKVVLRKTADGGQHWASLPAPPAPWGGTAPDGTGAIPADGVTSVLFADAEDGWAHGPGLWATHDGGLTWHRIITGGRVTQSMAVTGGYVVAVLLSCDPQDAGCAGPPSFTVETSPVAADAWRAVPGAEGQGTPSVTARAGAAYVAPAGLSGPSGHATLVTGPADGSARWSSRPTPCQPGAIALSAVTARSLVLSCATLGEHPEPTSLYSSADAGAHWTQFATLSLYDGASSIERTAGGTVLVAGIYDGVRLSANGGRTWSRPAVTDDAGATGSGAPVMADLFTNSDGYMIVAWRALWITRDGGVDWKPVTIH